MRRINARLVNQVSIVILVQLFQPHVMLDTIVHKEVMSKLSVLKVIIVKKNSLPVLKINVPLPITVPQVLLSLLNVQMEHIAQLGQVAQLFVEMEIMELIIPII